MKQCTKCQRNLPLEDFGKHGGKKSAKSGLRPRCKSCHSQDYKEYKAKNRDTVKNSQAKWRDSNPQAVREIWRRYQQKHRVELSEYLRNYRQLNIGEIKIQQAEYRKKNIEKKREYDRQWQKRNPEKVNLISHRRRARKADVRQSLVTETDIKNLLRKECIYCGTQAEHIEHVIPISRGGPHSLGNLAASCKRCNLSKGALLVSEWKYRKYKYGY